MRILEHSLLLRYFRKLWIYGLNCRNENGSGILIHYTTIFGTKFSPKKSGFLQKSTLGKHTMKNWIILWFWNIANPFTSKDLCVNLKEDVNFVKLQVFKSWKKVVGFSKLTTPKINIFLKFLNNSYSVRDLLYFKTTKKCNSSLYPGPK